MTQMQNGINSLGQGECGYLAFYNGKQIEVRAHSSYMAHQKACEAMRVPRNKSHMCHVHIVERADGQRVIHSTSEI